MKPHVSKNRDGFTVIELLVAMVLLAFLLITMLYGYIYVYRLSFENLLKDEVVKVGQGVLERLRSTPYDTITTSCVPCNPRTTNSNCFVLGQIRNTNVKFGIQIGVSEDIPNVKKITVLVCTNYRDHKGSNIEYKATSIITKKG